MKALFVCLCLSLLPALCQQSGKPSPFDLKPVEERQTRAVAPPSKSPSAPSDPSGNTGIATFSKPAAKTAEPDEMTAVHVALPVGSHVRVVNLDNDKAVVVRITGRAEFPPGRIISVDYQAAKNLDFLRAGTARVRLEPLEK